MITRISIFIFVLIFFSCTREDQLSDEANEMTPSMESFGRLIPQLPSIPDGRMEVTPFVSLQTKDSDSDGLPDAKDNCTQKANADQADWDMDGYGDECDGKLLKAKYCFRLACPFFGNGTQWGKCLNRCLGGPTWPSGPSANYSDTDGDTVVDAHDNCLSGPNPDQTDLNLDGIGDACLQLVSPQYGRPYELFGHSVSLSGDRALIGSHWNSKKEFQGGSAHVWRYDGNLWTVEQEITPSHSEVVGWFGHHVALSATVAAVSSLGADRFSGKVFIYEQVSGLWTEKQVLTPSAHQRLFGYSLSLSSSSLVVGTPGLVSDEKVGEISIFGQENGSWVLGSVIKAPEHESSFGMSVAHDGVTLVVGAPAENCAYLYENVSNQWILRKKLLSSVEKDGFFGFSLSLDGNQLAIGAPRLRDTTDVGSVSIFSRETGDWLLARRFAQDSAEKQQLFGHSVALSGTLLLANGRVKGAESEAYSSTYLYENLPDGQWRETTLLQDYDLEGLFLPRLAISPNWLVIGLGADPSHGKMSGSALIMHR